MTICGSCGECGAPLAGDQRHCVICGTAAVLLDSQAGDSPAVIETMARRGTRRGIPVPPGAAAFAALLALGLGGGIGSAIGPGVDEILAATPSTVPPPTRVAAVGGSERRAGGDRSGPSGEASAASPAVPSPVPVAPAATPAPVVDPPEDEVPPEDPGDDDPGADDPLPPDDSTSVSGVVIRVNPIAESYTLASGGALTTVHSKDLPDPGIDVSALVVPLFNGTFSEAEQRKDSRQADSATFSGTVTLRDEENHFYVLSSPGASVPVRVPAAGPGEDIDMPEVSASVTVEVDLDPGAEPLIPADAQRAPAANEGVSGAGEPEAAGPDACDAVEPSPSQPIDPGLALVQSSYRVDFETLASTGLEGVVQQVCPGADRILISGDDLREGGRDLLLAIPRAIDPKRLRPGTPVSVNADPTPDEDGVLALSGLAADAGRKGADDVRAGLGDKR